MKKITFFVLLTLPCWVSAQIGIKAGLNFANVSGASSVNNSSRTGWHAGVIIGSPFKKLLGYRTELLYSKQGYDYTSGTSKGTVGLNYIGLASFLTVGITRYFQLQLGFQTAYLLNAKADSTKDIPGLPGSYKKILDITNRLDYGLAGGVEIHPAGGLLLGARINISLSKLYKDAASSQDGSVPGIDIKNNLFQLFLGWRFGK